MRKILTLLLIVFTIQNAFAQNWKLVNRDEKYNYINKDNYYTISTDSVKEIHGDSVLYLNKVTKKVRKFTGNLYYYLPKQSQFFFSRIIYKPDYVIMQENDSVKYIIKPHAKLDDTWVFDSLHNNIAQVISVSTSSIFGNIDSIKVIKVGISERIILSKNYGILKFPLFDSLPEHVTLVGIEGRNAGVVLPKFNEFYDFNVGDVFYYKLFKNNGRQGTEQADKKVTIKSKLIQGNKSTYTFEYYDKWVTNNWNGIKTTYHYAKDSVISYTDSASDYLNKYPNDPLGKPMPTWKDKPIHVNNDATWQTITKSYTDNSFCVAKNDTLEEQNGIGCVGSFPPKEGRKHGKGLGCILFYDWSFGGIVDYSTEEKLTGCIKNGKTIGTIIPDSIFLSVTSLNASTSVKIYPNPAKNSITIENMANKGNQHVYIYDVRGDLVMECQINSKTEINISSLSNGMYFIKLIGEQSVDVIKILKE